MVQSDGEMNDSLQAYELLTEEEKDLLGRAIDVLVHLTGDKKNAETVANACLGALALGYHAGCRAVEQFAILANKIEGRPVAEIQELLVEFIRKGQKG